MRSKITTIAIILCTLVLAGLAVFASIRLYMVRTKGIAEITSQSNRRALVADMSGCKSLAFNFGNETAVAAALPSVTPTPTPTPSYAPIVQASPSPSVSPTPFPALPEAGISLPTIAGVVIGIFTIIGTFILIMAPI